MAPRSGYAAGIALALCAASAAAQEAPAACAVAHADPAAFAAALEGEGLAALPAQEAFSEGVLDRLSWILAAEYLATDTGGQPLEDLLASQRMAAGNLTRLAPLPTATTRVLTDGDDVVIAAWRVTPLGDVEQQCRLTAPDWFEAGEAEPTASGVHGWTYTSTRVTEAGDISTIAFNVAQQVVGASAPAAVIDQTLRFPEDAP